MDELDKNEEEKFHNAVQVLDKALKSQKYVIGNEKTIADYHLASTLTMPLGCGVDISKHLNVVKWIKDLKATDPVFGVWEETVMAILEFYKSHWKVDSIKRTV